MQFIDADLRYLGQENVAGVDIEDFENVDLVKATEQYLEKLGLSKKEIADLKDRLK